MNVLRARLDELRDAYRLRQHPNRDTRILLVGDSIVHRLRLSALLRGAGFAVTVLPGVSGLDGIRGLLPRTGLLLVNLCSTSFDGMELVRTLHREGISGRVLVWALDNALERSADRWAVLSELGVRGFLHHGQSPEEILTLLNRLYFSELKTRRRPRRLLYEPASFHLDRGEVGVGYVTSLSSRGLFLQTLEPPREGQRLRLRFELGDGGPILEMVGEVIHRGRSEPGEVPAPSDGVGVRFEGVDPDLSERIRRFTEPAAEREPGEGEAGAPDAAASPDTAAASGDDG